MELETGKDYRAEKECTRPRGFLSAAINANDIWTQMTRWSWHVEPPEGEWGSVHDKYNFITVSPTPTMQEWWTIEVLARGQYTNLDAFNQKPPYQTLYALLLLVCFTWWTVARDFNELDPLFLLFSSLIYGVVYTPCSFCHWE